MNKDIKLGMEMQKLTNSWGFDKMVEFLKGKQDDKNIYNDYLTKLKPLYDEFGYTEVNNLILEIAEENKNE